MTPAELEHRLTAAVGRRYGTGARIANLHEPTLGGSNRTAVFDLEHDGHSERLVLRIETYRLADSPFISPNQQYRLLEAAHAHGVPVPRPVFELDDDDELGRGFVMAFVAGESMPKRLLKGADFAVARANFARDCGDILARLHMLDLTAVSMVSQTADSKNALAAQVERYDNYAECHPALDCAIRWLERNRPPAPATAKFVHGDFRLGNVLVHGNGIRALLDWECAHVGDPVEDFGWLCLRAWRFGNTDKMVAGIAEWAELQQAYVDAGGEQIDDDHLRWWLIFGSLRWAVINMMQINGHLSGQRRSPAFAACGRNTCLIEYDLMMTLLGRYT